MKHRFAALITAMMLLAAIPLETAAAAGLTVTLPAGPPGVVQAMNGAMFCGSALVSVVSPVTMTLDDSCATAGSTITFISNSVALASTVFVPASGSGNLVLATLNASQPIVIQIPAVANASGMISAVVNGTVCSSGATSAVSMTTLSLAATCATPGAVISFEGIGRVPLISTMTTPTSGGAFLLLSSLNSTRPVTLVVPAGDGTLAMRVDGQNCGLVTLGGGVTTVRLSAACAMPGGTLTFTDASGGALGAPLTLPMLGGTIGVSDLSLSGAFVTSVAFSSSGQAFVVFSGGAVDQLQSAAIRSGATGVWVQDTSGTFRLFIVYSSSFVNDSFRAQYAVGLPLNTAVTLVR